MNKIAAVALLLLIMTVSSKNLEIDGQFIANLSEGLYLIVKGLVYDFTHVYPEMDLDAYKSDSEIFQSRGFRFEQHSITTPDGYILTAWRVPGFQNETMNSIRKKHPVMLQHGLLDNSGTWTVNDFNQTLVYLLLLEGYDVWMTNTRGNFNSFEHVNPKEYNVFNAGSKFFDFTFDDMGKYDVSSNVDYILDYTNNKKLTYIGHSQGTMQFFIANCLYDLASKIDKFVGVGPVMYANHITSPAVIGIANIGLDKFLAHFYENNILIWPKIVGATLNGIANSLRMTIWRIIQFICGIGETINVDLNRVPVIGRREPGGTSLLNLQHWLQLFKSGNFRMMDFGKAKNIQIYGRPTPPFYDTDAFEKNVKDLPMFLIKGGNDALVSDQDFQHLLQHLQDKVGSTLEYIEVPGYGHLDYIWAKDSRKTVSEPIINFLKQ